IVGVERFELSSSLKTVVPGHEGSQLPAYTPNINFSFYPSFPDGLLVSGSNLNAHCVLIAPHRIWS
ncbi:MAG: hypothetical protein WC346_08035, partial [Methanogenium sp.]